MSPACHCTARALMPWYALRSFWAPSYVNAGPFVSLVVAFFNKFSFQSKECDIVNFSKFSRKLLFVKVKILLGFYAPGAMFCTMHSLRSYDITHCTINFLKRYKIFFSFFFHILRIFLRCKFFCDCFSLCANFIINFIWTVHF